MQFNATANVFKSSIAAALLALSVHAMAADAKPATAAATVSASIPPAKQELIDRILKVWHVEVIGQTMLQEPVANAVNQARAVLQGRAAPEKRDAAMKDITAEAKKFLDENTPVVTGNAQKLIPTTVAPLLAERFTEDELRQILAMLESPVKKKFEAFVPDVQKAMGEKLAAEMKAQINPKLDTLQEHIGMRLRTAVMP